MLPRISVLSERWTSLIGSITSADSVAYAHRSVLPRAIHDRLIMQSAAHVARVLPGVDVNHTSAAAPAATTVVRTIDGLIPVPAEIKELSSDVPVAHRSPTTEVAGNAADPVARAREVHAILRWSKIWVAVCAPECRRRSWRCEDQNRCACNDCGQQFHQQVNPQLNHSFRTVEGLPTSC